VRTRPHGEQLVDLACCGVVELELVIDIHLYRRQGTRRIGVGKNLDWGNKRGILLRQTGGYCQYGIAGSASLSRCVAEDSNMAIRAEAGPGGIKAFDHHKVVVTDCYRTNVPGPQQEKSNDEQPVFRYAPCKDAEIVIHGRDLSVNGTQYASLNAGDAVAIDHGKVLINDELAASR